MNIGNWDTAIVKAILIGFVPVPLFIVATDWELGRAYSSTEFMGSLLTLLLSFSLYLLVTLAAWVVVGFPVHRLSMKYFKSSWFLYISSPLILAGIAYLFWVPMAALLIGVFGFIQASVFRYYLYGDKKP